MLLRAFSMALGLPLAAFPIHDLQMHRKLTCCLHKPLDGMLCRDVVSYPFECAL